jgi:hypothetical protein
LNLGMVLIICSNTIRWFNSSFNTILKELFWETLVLALKSIETEISMGTSTLLPSIDSIRLVSKRTQMTICNNTYLVSIPSLINASALIHDLALKKLEINFYTSFLPANLYKEDAGSAQDSCRISME